MGHHSDLWLREHEMQRRMLSEWKMFQQKERLGQRFLLPCRVSRLALCSTRNVLIFHSRKRIAKFFVFAFLFFWVHCAQHFASFYKLLFLCLTFVCFVCFNLD